MHIIIQCLRNIGLAEREGTVPTGPFLGALLCILPGLALADASAPPIPDTPAGHALASWLNAFKTVAPHRIDDHFFIRISFGRFINPITKTDWERTGVEPDVKVRAADALDEALKRARSGQ
jgi:hypothetical protein